MDTRYHRRYGLIWYLLNDSEEFYGMEIIDQILCLYIFGDDEREGEVMN